VLARPLSGFTGSRLRGNDDKLKPARTVTRRRLLTLGLGLAALPARAAEPPAKSSQAEARYQNTPKGVLSCAVCSFFVKLRSCKVVTGDIAPTGWCKLFDIPGLAARIKRGDDAVKGI
jgi:hypothetical protein